MCRTPYQLSVQDASRYAAGYLWVGHDRSNKPMHSHQAPWVRSDWHQPAHMGLLHVWYAVAAAAAGCRLH